jgi:hypothetical protein
MKSLPLLALVLVTFAAPLQAEEEQEAGNCQASFELGKLAAREIPTRKWFWRSCALTCLLVPVALVIDMQNEDDLMLATTFAGSVCLGAAIVLPLTVEPRPECSPPDDPAVDRGCYEAGYTRKLRSRNTLASIGGFYAGSMAAYGIMSIYAIIQLAAAF